MKYAGIIANDFSAAPGVSTTFFVQGCPFRCKGCHNPETWDFDGGKEFTSSVLDSLYKTITANNIIRNLCIMGGEPLCERNSFLTLLVISHLKKKIPDLKVYVWTGYTLEKLIEIGKGNSRYRLLLNECIDVLIDGQYVEELRNVTLPMRGSSNQRILYKGKDF